MRAIGMVIENIADTDATVLIRGESGVGKDVVVTGLFFGVQAYLEELNRLAKDTA
jgi:transcriptional regulator with AAA-type ATPase domain